MINSKFDRYYRLAGSFLDSPGKMSVLMGKAVGKVSLLNLSNKEFRLLKEKIQIFIRMIKASMKKEYTNVPWKTLLAISAGLIYFVAPIDLIPDFIPITGFIDDFTILLWIFNNFNKDIEAFRIWEKA
jgi:uncharacterized membrane protein YkvA (DUF1232 family)